MLIVRISEQCRLLKHFCFILWVFIQFSHTSTQYLLQKCFIKKLCGIIFIMYYQNELSLRFSSIYSNGVILF